MVCRINEPIGDTQNTEANRVPRPRRTPTLKKTIAQLRNLCRTTVFCPQFPPISRSGAVRKRPSQRDGTAISKFPVRVANSRCSRGLRRKRQDGPVIVITTLKGQALAVPIQAFAARSTVSLRPARNVRRTRPWVKTTTKRAKSTLCAPQVKAAAYRRNSQQINKLALPFLGAHHPEVRDVKLCIWRKRHRYTNPKRKRGNGLRPLSSLHASGSCENNDARTQRRKSQQDDTRSHGIRHFGTDFASTKADMNRLPPWPRHGEPVSRLLKDCSHEKRHSSKSAAEADGR